MQFTEYKSIFSKIVNGGLTTRQDIQDVHDLLCGLRDEGGMADKYMHDYALKVSNFAKQMAEYNAHITGSGAFDDLYWRLLLFEARERVVDSYFLYLEKNRDPDKRFYEPRRDKFLQFGVTNGMQSLIDDEIDLLTISMCPGSGKSTAGIFFLSGCMGWEPELPNLASAHSGTLTRSFYDGISQILNDPVEYTWHEIFPSVKFNPRGDFNSKEQTINVGKPKRFKSLTCRAINASLTGATRCENILYADDLCSGIEEALSKDRLEKLWQTYNTDLKTRKKNFCKEIHIQTRWSVMDVVGRLQREHENDPRAKFIAIPAYNEDGESNFDYKYGVGFSTQYFQDMEKSMDDISFKCLYMNQPIEREGLLVHEDELRRYLSLPLHEPDAIWSIVDTKQKGTDYFFQPVLLQYGNDYYLDDCMCDNGSDYEVQYQRSTNILLRNKVQMCQYESNSGGDRVAEEVNKRIKAAGGYCNITQQYTSQNKETKILVYAPWWKEHVLFKDKSLYSAKDDYGVMISQILTYPVNGRADHDDCVDGLASFAKWRSVPPLQPTRIVNSPF